VPLSRHRGSKSLSSYQYRTAEELMSFSRPFPSNGGAQFLIINKGASSPRFMRRRIMLLLPMFELSGFGRDSEP